MTDMIRKSDALAVVLLGGSPVGMSNRIAALPAVTAPQGVDAILDAAHDYLVQQYGYSPLKHPVDRARIMAALALAPAQPAPSEWNAAIEAAAKELLPKRLKSEVREYEKGYNDGLGDARNAILALRKGGDA